MYANNMYYVDYMYVSLLSEERERKQNTSLGHIELLGEALD